MTDAELLALCNERYYDDGRSLRIRKPYRRSGPVGSLAGTKGKDGYRALNITGGRHRAHRILWLMRTGSMPKHEIDHIDGDPENNSPENLRDVPHAVNMRNQRRSRLNKSGVTGVYWHKRNKAWAAVINDEQGRHTKLGYYKDKEQAVAARLAAEERFRYHENHGRPL